MTNTEFKMWLRGYIELSETPTLDAHKLQILKNHANLVIDTEGKLDPELQDFLDECQKALRDLKQDQPLMLNALRSLKNI